jgi:hypothetical protein
VAPLADGRSPSPPATADERGVQHLESRHEYLQSIVSSIFGGPAAAAPISAASQSSTGSQAAAGIQRGTSAIPTAQVDVAAVLDGLADEDDEDLDWRKSIKLLKLDSSLTARTQLAQELRYTGNVKDTATMNIWLHKQVMTKLAENGGKVPTDLIH